MIPMTLCHKQNLALVPQGLRTLGLSCTDARSSFPMNEKGQKRKDQQTCFLFLICSHNIWHRADVSKVNSCFRFKTCEEHSMTKEILLAPFCILKGCIHLLISELQEVMKISIQIWNVLTCKSSGNYKSTEQQGPSEFGQKIQKTTQITRRTAQKICRATLKKISWQYILKSDDIVSEMFSAKQRVHRRKGFYLQKECLAVILAHTYKNMGGSVMFTVGKQTNKITVLDRLLLGSHENHTCGDQAVM